MQIILRSARFGTLQVPADAVIEFPSGLVGLGGDRWALLAHGDAGAFVWLHSLDDPDVAVPLTDPWRFFADYEVVLSDEDEQRTGLTGEDSVSVYVTVRAAEALEDFSANLRAPILISAGRGWQVLNQAAHAPLRVGLFASGPEERAA